MSKKRKTPYQLNRDEKAYIRGYYQRSAEAARSKIQKQVAEFAILALGVAAFDELGLAGDNLADFMCKFLNQYECILAGTVDLEDLRKLLAEEAGVTLNRLEEG